MSDMGGLDRLADALAAKLTAPADPASVPVSRRWGTVGGVNLLTGAYDVVLSASGITIPEMTAINGVYALGDVVAVDFVGPDPMIVGRVVDRWHVVDAVGEPAFQNSWVNSFVGSHSPTGFRKVGGRVEIQGLVEGGAVSTVIFTLPVGYRPIITLPFEKIIDGPGVARVDVESDGDVVLLNQLVGVRTGTSWVSLALNFLAS